MRWLPLESNPECINELINSFGVSKEFGFTDIIGFDEELLQFVLKPVLAVVFLYPTDLPNIDEDFTILSNQDLEKKSTNLPYFIKQTIGNACGTIAIIHALANNVNYLKFEKNFIFDKFYEQTKNLDAIEKANYLEKFEDISNLHQKYALQGETETPNLDENVNLHFICLVEHDGYLWKLDGRKDEPIRVAKANKENILEVSAEYCRNFMQKNKSCLKFYAMALSHLQN